MRLRIDARLDYRFDEPADILLQMEAAPLPDQRIVRDMLTIDTAHRLFPVPAHQGIGRRTWTRGDGRFVASYEAEVEVTRAAPDLAALASPPLTALPGEAIEYLWPSRYCQSDRLKDYAHDRFGALEGGARAAAMAEWTRTRLSYVPGSSDGETTACDTFLQRRGICRDYAHLFVAFARALDMPARMVSAYAHDLDPPDFHAVAEIWLEDGWHLVDPTGLAPVEGLVRIGVGRDATDISFMTIFGGAAMNAQSVTVERIG